MEQVMVNIKTCVICNYQTNIKGDLAKHKKERHRKVDSKVTKR